MAGAAGQGRCCRSTNGCRVTPLGPAIPVISASGAWYRLSEWYSGMYLTTTLAVRPVKKPDITGWPALVPEGSRRVTLIRQPTPSRSVRSVPDVTCTSKGVRRAHTRLHALVLTVCSVSRPRYLCCEQSNSLACSADCTASLQQRDPAEAGSDYHTGT